MLPEDAEVFMRLLVEFVAQKELRNEVVFGYSKYTCMSTQVIWAGGLKEV